MGEVLFLFWGPPPEGGRALRSPVPAHSILPFATLITERHSPLLQSLARGGGEYRESAWQFTLFFFFLVFLILKGIVKLEEQVAEPGIFFFVFFELLGISSVDYEVVLVAF